MPATIIGLSENFEFEPEIQTQNGRDGIVVFQFSIIGRFSQLNSAFLIGDRVSDVPDQPLGDFRVVNRSLSHIAGNEETGIYRLSVSAEGGEGNSESEITQSSYAYQKEEISALVSIDGGDFQPTRYFLEWLSPSVSITTNSREPNVNQVQERAKSLVEALPVQILRNRPRFPGAVYAGPSLDENKIIITGSNIETAGAIYRVSATATRGAVEER